MKIGRLLTLFACFLLATTAAADITLKATYTDKKGAEVVETDNFDAEAPLYVQFTSNPSDLDPAASIEWHITNTSAGINVTRYEEDTSFTFTAAGKNLITLNVVLEGDVIETKSITITISDNPYSYPDPNWATLYLKSAGADTVRPIKFRKKPSTGQWFLNDYQNLSDIRVPAADDPWA